MDFARKLHILMCNQLKNASMPFAIFQID